MEIEDSTLNREIQAILNDGAKPINFTWNCEIHVGTVTYVPVKIITIDFEEDHEEAYCPKIMLEVMLQGGVYFKQIYPAQENLEISLFKKPLSESSGDVNESSPQLVQRYRATLIDKGNALSEGNMQGTPSQEVLDQSTIMLVEFQLLSKPLEQLRMMSLGGSYRSSTVQNFLQTIITYNFNQLVLQDSQLPKGVDMVTPNNTATRDSFVIPQGLPLVNVVDYVQNKCGGIYSSGLGSFIKDDFWYIYPKYDVTRFSQSSRTLTIIRVPPNKLPSVERTYRQQGGATIILATSEANLQDQSDPDQLNKGNGVRFADASTFMDSFVTVKDNKATARRGASNSEYVANQRTTGNNNVKLSTNPINANPYREYSRLAQRQGGLYTFVWENSNPDLLIPGMQIKIMYLDGDDIKQILGTLHAHHSVIQMYGKGATSNRYTTQTAIAVFINRNSG